MALMSESEPDDEPAFAPTLHSILDRYRHAAIDRLNAVKALTGITLALAPADLFDDTGEARLDLYFETQLERYRVADGHTDEIRDEVVAFVWAVAQGHHDMLGKVDGARTLGL
jgi:hypothetical protein